MNNSTNFKFTDAAYEYLIAQAAANGISQRQLALKIGIEPQQITNTLRRGNVKISSLKQMADILDIEVQISLTDKTKNYGFKNKQKSK